MVHINKDGIQEIISIDGFNGRVVLKGVTQNAYQPVRFMDPIPLTPEILEKCGFKQSENLGSFIDFEKNGVILKIDWTKQQIKRLKDFSIRFEFNRDDIDIKHLHQLQNLYFALTGEELKINLNVEAHQ